MSRERVIFDNTGGITVHLDGWSRCYLDAKVAAEDVQTYLETRNTTWWDDHEPEALALDPTIEEINNGGYRVWDIGDTHIQFHTGNPMVPIAEAIQGWHNMEEFFKALEAGEV